jgi:hypothetical protein
LKRLFLKLWQGVVQNIDLILFSLLVGFIATSISYSFGDIDHIEQVPLIYRAIDASYLQNDFFVNNASQFGPRYIYSHAIGWLVRFFPITNVFFFLTLLSNILISLCSGFFSIRVLRGSRLSAMIGICAVMTLRTFSLGSVDTIYRTQLVPSLLAMPFLLFAMWAGFKTHPFRAAILSGIASIFHPTLGLEVGGIAFLIAGAGIYLENRDIPRAERDYRKKEFGAGSLVFALFFLLYLIPYLNAPGIDSREFVKTLAYFRHPHYLVASSFETRDIRHGIYFASGSILALFMLFREHEIPGKFVFQVAFLGFMLLTLVVMGVVFIEKVPTRLMTVIQPFRLLFILKWLGLLFVSVLAGSLIAGKEGRSAAQGYLTVFSLLTPTALLVNQLFTSAGEFWRKKQREVRLPLGIGLVFTLLLAYLLFYTDLDRKSSLAFVGVIAVAFIAKDLGVNRRIQIVVLLSLMIAIPILTQYSEKLPRPIAVQLEPYRVELGLRVESGELQELTDFVEQNTPADAVFLTPPFFGRFRLTARRAILVDYRAMPFQDQAMQAWKMRLSEIYDAPTTMNYLSSAEKADENYRLLTDQRLLEVEKEFPFDYAVLYAGTATAFPVIFESGNFKVIEMPAS